jgi:hypothetical protein
MLVICSVGQFSDPAKKERTRCWTSKVRQDIVAGNINLSAHLEVEMEMLQWGSERSTIGEFSIERDVCCIQIDTERRRFTDDSVIQLCIYEYKTVFSSLSAIRFCFLKHQYQCPSNHH